MGWFYNPPPQPPTRIPEPVGATAEGNAPPTPVGNGQVLAAIRSQWTPESWAAQAAAQPAAWLATPAGPLLSPPFSRALALAILRSLWPSETWDAQYRTGQAAWLPAPLGAPAAPPPHIEPWQWPAPAWPAQPGARGAAAFATTPATLPSIDWSTVFAIRSLWLPESWAAQASVQGAALGAGLAPVPYDLHRPRAPIGLWPQPDWPAQRAGNVAFTFPVLVPPVPYFTAPRGPIGLWPQPAWRAQSGPLYASAASGPPPPAPGFRVRCITSGTYGGVYYQPGDVFDLVLATDYSDSTVNYSGVSSGEQQFGWMLRVPASTPLYSSELQAGWVFPLIDPVPPKRTVY